MTFLVVILNTHAKTATLNIPTLRTSSAQQKFPQKIDFLLCLGVHLQLITPINYDKNLFSPRDARAPSAAPDYAFGLFSSHMGLTLTTTTADFSLSALEKIFSFNGLYNLVYFLI